MPRKNEFQQNKISESKPKVIEPNSRWRIRKILFLSIKIKSLTGLLILREVSLRVKGMLSGKALLQMKPVSIIKYRRRELSIKSFFNIFR